jgi:Domain of unknown function (DUF6316)
MSDTDKPSDVRAGEKPQRHFRTPDRCFRTNGHWYFATREGINVGPYDTQTAAHTATTRLVPLLRATDKTKAEVIIRDFIARRGDPWPGRSPP